ncbi:hypothetical protein MHYP_G00165680 [Metynnis hypsauchen]
MLSWKIMENSELGFSEDAVELSSAEAYGLIKEISDSYHSPTNQHRQVARLHNEIFLGLVGIILSINSGLCGNLRVAAVRSLG